MARLFNGSTDRLDGTVPTLAAYPISCSAWIRIDTTTTGSYFVSALGDGTFTNFLACYVQRVAAGGGAYRAASEAKDAGAQDAAVTGNTSINQTWAHVFFYFAGVASRFAYVNGTASAENTTSVSPTGLTQQDVGHAAATGFWPGRIAELAWYDSKTFTQADIDALANGASPLTVHPQYLVGYWPLMGRHSPEIDLVQAHGLTITSGTSAAEHCRVFLPNSPMLGIHFEAPLVTTVPSFPWRTMMGYGS